LAMAGDVLLLACSGQPLHLAMVFHVVHRKLSLMRLPLLIAEV
jgi:hypothetical protein